MIRCTAAHLLWLSCAMFALCATSTPAPAQDSPNPAAPAKSFRELVDLDALGNIAVQHQGRIKSLQSHTAQIMSQVSGLRSYNNQPDLYTYIDIILNPHAYDDAPIISVKKAVRQQLADASTRSAQLRARPDFDERLELLRDKGMASFTWLAADELQFTLAEMRADLIRTAKHANAVDNAMSLANAAVLADLLRIVPSESDDARVRWMNVIDIMQTDTELLPSPLSDGAHASVLDAWSTFVNGWLARDAEQTNNGIAKLTTVLQSINPQVYPEATRIRWENTYGRLGNLTWIWLFYALAMVPLLLGIVFRWPGAFWAGSAMFLLAFILQTGAIILRWYVAARWPNSNMFEAVTTAAWFGGCGAILLEALVWRTPMRGMFMLCSAVASMVALMCAHFMPLSLDASISNMMPVLHDVWLYIHTNVIIFSYCLIFMAAVTGVLYLGYRTIRKVRGQQGAHEFARVGGAASLLQTGADGHSYIEQPRTTFGQVLDGTTMVLMEMSFVLLWAGIAMGAIWADHSWGRPWGWDPKEVFALNTFIVFIILIHTRMKVRDKGLWTAIIAIIGAAVMLFNWIAINFVIVGLHSYA